MCSESGLAAHPIPTYLHYLRAGLVGGVPLHLTLLHTDRMLCKLDGLHLLCSSCSPEPTAANELAKVDRCMGGKCSRATYRLLW